MSNDLQYFAILLPIAFVVAYCVTQSVINVRERRHTLAVAGAVCALLAAGMLVVEAYNAGLILGVFPSVRAVGPTPTYIN